MFEFAAIKLAVMEYSRVRFDDTAFIYRVKCS